MKISTYILSLTTCVVALLSGQTRLIASPSLTDTLSFGESKFAPYGTNRVHYVIGGKGSRAVVFIHGWGGNVLFWREQVPALKDKAKLILVDLPGHGQSDKPHAEYTMDFLASGVLAVLSDSGVSKATLVGHSMGVPVICRVYAQAPGKTAALVAVDGIMRRPKGTPEDMEKFIAPFHAAGYREHTTKFIGAMFPASDNPELRDWVLAQVLATPQYVLSSAMDGMFKPGQPAWDLDQVSIPVLVINAKNPMWTSEYEAFARSRSPKNDYRTIEDAGHFLMLEKPKEFNAALVAMLDKFQLAE